MLLETAVVLFFVVPAYSSLSEILQLQSNYCIVALLDSSPHSILSEFFRSFASEFSNNVTENEIRFLQFQPPFIWNDGTELSNDCLTDDVRSTGSCTSEIIVFKRVFTDPKCLFPPPKPEKVSFDAKYADPIYGVDFVNFINRNCGTYFTKEGKINNEGILKNDLETALTASRNTEVTMRDVLREKAPYTSCNVIEVPSPESFLGNFLSISKPVVIKKAAANWPAVEKWSLKFLETIIPMDRKVSVKVAPFGEFEGVENISLWEDFESFEFPELVKKNLPFADLVVVRPAILSMTFHQLVKAIASKEFAKYNASLYLEYSSVKDYLDEMTADVHEPRFISEWLSLESSNIWFSDGNTLGKLHFDPFDNILVMVEGEKEVTLFDPFDNSNLYESHIQEANLSFNPRNKTFHRRGLQQFTSVVMSPVDIAKPNLQRFSKFADARPMKCKISKGDALFLPAFWWHEVQSFPSRQNFNLAINFWYEPLYQKVFPCATCPLKFNHAYRHLLQHLF